MSRVRAEALVLVNWKGVFYARYELDRHVTALEGDNGAGKTTVMIGAYVVLLPDMTRLRFTNLGETGATGGDKGIWGRLGEPGRPAYAALDFRLPGGERVVAGVHLERKGEPTVEPTPFLITGLGDDVRLQSVLLLGQGELELVPELSELRDNVGRLGGRLQVFGSARDYFAALFERGITPMRLGTDEEKNKLNEMLRTSMTGGMSRGLLSELRSFLLKEEGGLAETLQRMRANLDACRRTRTEVGEARRLEREIGEVYEAGEQMFAAAIEATRRRAEEMGRRVVEAEAKKLVAEQARVDAEAALSAAVDAVARVETEKGQADERVRLADAEVLRVAGAVRWAEAETERRAARVAAEAAELGAKVEAGRAANALAAAVRDLDAAGAARDAAAAGLADLQAGLDELHRRADAHRRVVARLAEARTKLGRPELAVDDVQATIGEAEARLGGIDRERRDLARRISDADKDRAEHAEALSALATVLGRPAEVDDVHAVARDVLARVGDWRLRAERRAAVRSDLAVAEAEAGRQARARERAADLGLVWEEGQGRAAVEAALADVDAAVAEVQQRATAADAAVADAERQSRETTARLNDLDVRLVDWRALTVRAARLGESAGFLVDDREALDRARDTLLERQRTGRASLDGLQTRRATLERDARELLHAGGSFAPELLRVRDDLTAELLATHFDHLSVDAAAEIEARLGPLARALVVADLEAATTKLRQRPESLDTVWLLQEDAALSIDPDHVVGRAEERDVVVDERDGRRVTRIPTRPTLGRAAREQRAAELRREAEGLEPAIGEVEQELRATGEVLQDADALLVGVGVWTAGDPAPEIEANRRAVSSLDAQARRSLADAQAARSREAELVPRRRALVDLLGDAALLDVPGLASRAAALQADLVAAEHAVAELSRVGDAPARLEVRLDALRHVPWTAAELVAARERLAVCEAARDTLDEGLEALRYVVEHRGAFDWIDAEGRLQDRRALVPALHAQLDESVGALVRAKSREQERRTARDAVVTSAHTAAAAATLAAGRHDEALAELEKLGVEDPTPGNLVRVQAAAEQAKRSSSALGDALAGLYTDKGTQVALHTAAEKAAVDARVALDDEHKQARPALEGWERLRPQASREGLLSDRFERLFGGQGSVNLWQEARAGGQILVDRLRHAKGADELLADVGRWLSDQHQTSGEGYLRAWVLVRDWLRRRLPAQIADVDEPLVALARLRDHLVGLDERLDRQEQDLRGESEDVARGIEVHVRKAQGRVRRLNEHLAGIQFGSVRGIHVQMQRVERMEQVLKALKTGEAQELLFSTGMPVEEALDQIFQKVGGGRNGGQRLLDYREYVHLQVEVMRQGASTWEVANPTRLSTGEAIGVGAALMMVVLTEWERDASLLRGRRQHGSMRFLFLDEANRLDQANLSTLFELCRTLDLQLLVACPEVARARGCTVFRLVRTKSQEGQDEVLVSGRRVVGEA